MSDPIYCIHCGNPFVANDGYIPSNYGKAKVYFECACCGRLVTMEILTLRMEPDYQEIYSRRMSDGL